MELIVKPILTYNIYERKVATSWRSWGGIQTESDLAEEKMRIEREISDLSAKADFPLRMLPLTSIRRTEELNNVMDEIESSDVILLYAAGGEEELLRKIISHKPSILFVRHKSGPIYLWYEIAHPILIRRKTDEIAQPWMEYDDVVVDEYSEVIWRLRAYYGLKNTIGTRVISIGEPGGWGIEERAVMLACLRWNLDIKVVSYEELSERIRRAKASRDHIAEAERRAEEYLTKGNVSLKTDRRFFVNAFLLHRIFRDILEEFGAEVITVRRCMSTIMPVAETTACLPLSLLNDEGYIAFCESDFVAIPSGILLHYISGKPVFLNDPTYPHDGIVTLAHCTAPRRMDGRSLEDVEILTHFESNYGAAPKVNFRSGQEVTIIIPDFDEELWVGFKGRILDSPCFRICRSQVDIRIEGDWRKLLKEMRGFHWMMAYGDYLREIGYALSKMGIKWKVI